MPWDVASSKKHIKGLTKQQRSKWANTANGILKDCQSKGGKDCEAKAIRIANSKFSKYEGFNLLMSSEISDKILQKFGGRAQFMEALKRQKDKKEKKEQENKKRFSYQKETRPDPQDGHIHVAMLDNSGNGNTDIAGSPAHSHVVKGFIVQP